VRKGLAKRPDARFRSCQEFADELDKACATTKGWKLMPRAGMLSAPTLAEAQRPRTSVAPLPPPRRPRRSETTSTVAGEPKRKGGFLPFLLAMLLAAGLLAVIGWQAAPWVLPPRPGSHAAGPQTARHPTEVPRPQDAPQAKPVQQQPAGEPAPLPPAPGTPAPQRSETDAKPSPMDPPPARQTVRDPGDGSRRLPAQAGPLQDVLVLSNPSGATARLDGVASSSCTTPCTLQAPPGRHTISFLAAGHQPEQREIIVGGSPMEIAPVTLRAAGGTLMLTSAPEGASVTVNGRRLEQVTPANLALPAGVYTITLEKDGHQASERVEIKETVTAYRKIVLGQ
jgi:hypothetical protein